MGHELNLTGRPIVYSCSWPAYMIDHPEMVSCFVLPYRNHKDEQRFKKKKSCHLSWIIRGVVLLSFVSSS